MKKRLLKNKPGLPFKYILGLTYKCNSRCQNCHIWKIYQKKPNTIREELTQEDLEKIFREIKKDVLILELTGGEPFTRSDIESVLNFAGQHLPSHCYLGITTNGFLETKIVEIMERTLKNIKQNFVMAVSLDGDAKTHKLVRGIPNAFEKSINTYLALKKLAKKHTNFFPHLSYTIFPQNAGKLEYFLALLKDNYKIQPEEVSITIADQGALYHLEKNFNLDRKEILTIKDSQYFLNLAKSAKISNLFLRLKNNFKIFYLKNIENFIKHPKKMILDCQALKTYAYIDPYGNVFPCISWPQNAGNIKRQSIREIWYSKRAKDIRKKIKEKKCPNCWLVCDAQPSYLTIWPFLKNR